ncbi:Bacteriophage protein [Mycobacteroides abscessus subsp. abscessus]|uniref:hypothetical protein n=1 Tax=Mycobacteroides abscessus TaxID=36809 RepID=UPI00092C24EB|nr:hypothetical protein [Mycobacteroides abscessus]SII79563.1 Bacteriophage protein [Mycobacteroides abscessus subsp. abscessus]SII85090.1 Bacteriophage protein [Mycobacteroides abscessus subsp. abscessus]SIL59818.1 Bacteriophage protein [Mycobacteroides abscessus subsp. abscessus]
MSDIAKRLRVQVDRSERWSDDYHQDESLWAIAREAADEIERLEERIAEQDQELRYWSNR